MPWIRTPISSLATTRAAQGGRLSLPRSRTLAHGQAERAADQAAWALVGQRMETLVIDRQGMNARPKRRGCRNRRRQRFRPDATLATAVREVAMTHDIVWIKPILRFRARIWRNR